MEILRTPPADPRLPKPAETLTSHTFWDKYGKFITFISFIVNISFIISTLNNKDFYAKENSQVPVQITITSTSLIPSITPTPTLDLHQHWQTYTNHTLGIQFQYPDGWEVDGPFEQNYLPGIVNDIFISEQKRIPYINDRVKAFLFSYKLDIGEYITKIYKDDVSVSIYKGILSTSPYIITEYLLTHDINKYPTDIPPATKWWIAPEIVYYISVEKPDYSKRILFWNLTANPRILYDIAGTFKFMP